MSTSVEFEIVNDKGSDEFYCKCNRVVYPDGFGKFGKNKTVFPLRYAKFADSILQFQIRNDDTWVLTYPKSGTTWTQEMVWLIGNDLNYEGAKSDQHQRSPFFEFKALWECYGKEQFEPLLTRPTSMSICDSLPSPRFIYSHLPVELLPIGLWTVRPKIIYVSRNVKDVCLSHFHHMRTFEGYSGSLDEFVVSFCTGNTTYAPYWSHVQEFSKLSKEANILFLRYEDMKNDLKSVIRKVSAFLNKSLDHEEIQGLAQHLSLESMRRNPYVNWLNCFKYTEAKNTVAGEDRDFFRKGKVGSWKEELSPESIAKLDEYMETHRVD